MAKILVEWGRVSAHRPASVPDLSGQTQCITFDTAFRLASQLAFTMSVDNARDVDAMHSLTAAIARGSNSAFTANGRAVFWAHDKDWFVSLTHTERHPLDGGYAATACKIMRSIWQPIFATRQANSLEQAVRALAAELQLMRKHYLPELCQDGNPVKLDALARARYALESHGLPGLD